MDETEAAAQRVLVELGQAIKDALGERSQRWLAAEVGIDPAQINRIIKGDVPGLALATVLRIEEALGLTQGQLLRDAGVVSGELGVLDAIASDGRLDAESKRTLKFVYRAAVTASGR